MEPDALFEALEDRFLDEGSPGTFTLTHSAGIGDKDRAVWYQPLAHEGMVKRAVGDIGDGRRNASKCQ